ncbi:MAG: choice-of-anchor Q domain-containing protein [Candidatus Kerfeldbacteria bacterium]
MERFHLIKALAITGTLSVCFFALSAVPASADTFVVTKSADTNDGTCDNDCSLREAIRAANDQLGEDSISLPAGTYTLSIAGRGEEAASTGDLDIEENLVFWGSHATTTFIDADELDRVFQVEPGVTFELHSVTIRDGVANVNANGYGGGLFNSGTLKVYDCIFESNTATYLSSGASGTGYGGGIYSNNGTIDIIEGTTFKDNIAVHNTTTNIGTGYGGGVYNNNGTLTELASSSFENNRAEYNTGTGTHTGFGGGLWNGGTVGLVKYTQFTENAANESTQAGNGWGGGLYNAGTMNVVRDSTFSENTGLINNSLATASGQGGGVYNSGTLKVLQRVTLEGNHGKTGSGPGGGSGGAIRNIGDMNNLEDLVVQENVALDYDGAASSAAYAGGLSNNGTILKIQRSTFSGNIGRIGSGAGDVYGGGIFDQGAINALENSTISGNTALYDESSSGTNRGEGGGYCNYGSGSTLTNVTIADNAALVKDGANTSAGYGGGFYIAGTMTLSNSIVADNTAGGAGDSPDCDNNNTMNTNGYNIVSDTTNCNWSLATGDRTDTDPDLNELADNGGFGETHSLKTGSLAIDQIPIANCSLATDQRVLDRPEGTKCDMGAVEMDQTAPVLTVVGDSPMDILINDEYIERWASATDNFDNNVQSTLTYDEPVNTGKIGTYYVTYTATDRDGNVGTVQRTVNVISRGDVTELVPMQNTELKVKYSGGTEQTFDVFAKGKAKPKCKLSKDEERIVCVKYSGRNVSVLDAQSGEVYSKSKIRKYKQSYVKFKVMNFYDDDPKNEIIVATIRGSKLRTTILTLTDANSNLKNKNTKKEDPFTSDGFTIKKYKKRVQIKYRSNVLHQYKVNSDRDLEDWGS